MVSAWHFFEVFAVGGVPNVPKEAKPFYIYDSDAVGVAVINTSGERFTAEFPDV
jgi:hypothetical protein